MTKNVSQGVNIPIDVTAIAWKGTEEAWLASRSGAVRLQNSKTVKTYTENDGLESELVHDVIEGLGGNIWIATSRGIGVWDGQRWSFPKAMPYNAKATALARDPDSRVWIGTDKGVYEVVNEKQFTFISSRSGLLDDKVPNLGIDVRGRVWVLTEKASPSSKAPKPPSSPQRPRPRPPESPALLLQPLLLAPRKTQEARKAGAARDLFFGAPTEKSVPESGAPSRAAVRVKGVRSSFCKRAFERPGA